MSRVTDLQHQLAEHGYTIATWRPGDGKTRYRICRIGTCYDETDGIATALGLAECRAVVGAFLAGVAEGLRRRETL